MPSYVSKERKNPETKTHKYKCLKCPKMMATPHGTGLCRDCRTQKCTSPGCENKVHIRTLTTVTKCQYCQKASKGKLRDLYGL